MPIACRNRTRIRRGPRDFFRTGQPEARVDERSADLLQRYRHGDDAAADELFRRYVARLTVLARTRLGPRLPRRVDAEDVVMSAYRSFFVRTRDGRFTLSRSGDLWRLLAAITLRKLHHTAQHHQAGRRDPGREQPGLDGESW